jgi:zinc/manganese transport system substrate-binding protein
MARRADLFIEVGLDLELWAEKVVSGSGNARIQSGQPGRVVASLGVQALELPTVLSREWGDVHPYGNPHVWLDPLNARTMAGNIAAALEKADPGNAADYRAGLERFERRIDEALFGADLVAEVGGKQLGRQARGGRLSSYLERAGLSERLGGWLKKAEVLRGRPIVTYHKTSAYLRDRFGFEVPVEIEEKPGIPPSARHRDEVLETMRAQGVRTILEELYYDRTAADYLAGKTGARVVVVPIDVGSEVGAADYFALIDHVLDDLVASESR